MFPQHLARASLAILSLAALAACADGPTGTSTSRVLVQTPAAAIQTPGGGELWVCKAGNTAGTFHFAISYSHKSGPGSAVPSNLALTSTDVDVGSCVEVASSPVTGSDVYLASIVETGQTNWALSAVTAIKGNGSDVTASLTINLGTLTASGARLGNDRGTTVVFTNTFTPPTVTPEGCSPGYYKKHLQPGNDQLLGDIFSSTPGALAGYTLQDALHFEGGPTLTDKEKILLRQAAAGYFNIGWLGAPPYPLSLTDLQNLVNDALDTGNATTILNVKDQIAGDNNLEGPKC